MGIPQITTITPDEGLTSGRGRVVIRGALFRVQESSSETGELEPTVSVTFNGEEAEAVLPVAHYRLDVVTPRYLGDPTELPKTVDVVVTNLDDNGDPISGETVTAADGFTYRHPDLVQLAPDTSPTSFSTVEAIHETFLIMLRRDLLPEVAAATDPDWSDDPSSGLTAVASLPALLVDGPMISESLDYRFNGPVETNNDDVEDTVMMTVHPFTARLSWSIVIVSDRKHDAVHALNAAVALFRRRPALDVPVKAGSSDTYQSDLTFEEWNTDDRPQDQIYSYSTTVHVEPVYFTDDYGYASDGVPSEEVTVGITEDSDEFLELEVEAEDE